MISSGFGGVSLSDYEGIEGFGVAPLSDVIELQKALEAGFAISSQTGGGALRVESLEASLKVLTYTQQAFKLWQDLPKLPAYSTVEEYNELVTYGNEGAGLALPEGHLPEEDDTNYVRRTSLVKFFGTTRVVTHPMTLVRPAHGDVIALENQNGIMRLLRTIENALFFGDSGLAQGGQEGVEFDGLDSLIDSANVVDLQGQPMTESDIETGANIIAENFGLPTHMYMGTRIKSDLVKQFYPRERIQLPAPTAGQIGFRFDTFSSQVGVINVRDHLFLQPAPKSPTVATSTKAPAAPATVTGALNATGNGDFAKSTAGDYIYKVAAGNRFGISAATASSAVALVDVTDQIDLTITNAASPGNLEYFAIYRTRADGTDAFLIAKVAATDITGSGTNSFSDLNPIMAGFSKAYMLEMSPQVISFKQLAPLMKMDLATIAPSIRWMILLYGVLQLYAPKKAVRYTNIGVTGVEVDTLAATQASGQIFGGGPLAGPAGPFI